MLIVHFRLTPNAKIVHFHFNKAIYFMEHKDVFFLQSIVEYCDRIIGID